MLGGAGETANTRALIFNVKGEDLLFLDHPNTRLDDATRDGVRPARAWPPAPFPDVRVYAPPRAGDSSGTPDVSSRLTGVDTLLLDAGGVLRRPAAAVRLRRRRRRAPAVHDGGALGHRAPGPARAQPRRRRRSASTARRLDSYADLVDHIVEQLTDDETRARLGGQRGRPRHGQRVRPPADRQQAGPGPADPRRPGRPAARTRINTAESAQVTVVDLHNLPDRAQRFVVGVTLKTEFERKEKAGTAKPLLFVVLDELNKYAPARGLLPDQGGAARHRRAGPLARA